MGLHQKVWRLVIFTIILILLELGTNRWNLVAQQRPNDDCDVTETKKCVGASPRIARVLKWKELGPVLDGLTGTFDSRFFPNVSIVHSPSDCTVSWEEGWKTMGGGKMNEMFQEVGFYKFFNEHYSLSSHISNVSNLTVEQQESSRAHLFFLPFCFYAEGNDYIRAWKKLESQPVTIIAATIAEFADNAKQMFHVMSHPWADCRGWYHAINNARALRVDQTIHGALGDIMIPQTVKRDLCPLSCQGGRTSRRDLLLFGCGAEHTWRQSRYKGLRQNLFQRLNDLNKTDIFASTSMSYAKYKEGFVRSKFCLVVPGDTTSTSQGSRAMCAECVPVYIAPDFRELPFANLLNYATFSIRKTPMEVLAGDGLERLYKELKAYIEDGTYEELHSCVCLARDFFNYHQFGPRSPYAASILSIQYDRITSDWGRLD